MVNGWDGQWCSLNSFYPLISVQSLVTQVLYPVPWTSHSLTRKGLPIWFDWSIILSITSFHQLTFIRQMWLMSVSWVFTFRTTVHWRCFFIIISVPSSNLCACSSIYSTVLWKMIWFFLIYKFFAHLSHLNLDKN